MVGSWLYLFPEQPLVHLGAVVAVGRNQRRVLGQVQDDRIGLRQYPLVIQQYRGHLPGGIHGKERLGPSLALGHVDVDPSEWNPEPFGGPFDLQTIA
jgi:hypothetical protein